MAVTDTSRLRRLLGETIPEGGDASNTMFSDEEVADFLDKGTRTNKDYSVEAAAYWGWQAKMAEFANLVNVNEGNAAREMGELHKAAKRMVDQFSGYVPTPSRGRARIGNVIREVV